MWESIAMERKGVKASAAAPLGLLVGLGVEARVEENERAIEPQQFVAGLAAFEVRFAGSSRSGGA